MSFHNSNYVNEMGDISGQDSFNNLANDPTSGANTLPPRQRLHSGKLGLKVTVPSAAPARISTDTAYGSLSQSSTSMPGPFDMPGSASHGSTTSPYGNHPGFIAVPGSSGPVYGNADMYNGPASLSPLSAPSPLSRPLSPHELPPPSPVPSDGGHSSGGLSPAGHSPHGSGHGLSPLHHSPNGVASTSPNDDMPPTPSAKLRGRSNHRAPQVTIPPNQSIQQPRSAGPYYRQQVPTTATAATKRSDAVGDRFQRRQSVGSRSPSHQPGSLRRVSSATSSRAHSPYRSPMENFAQVANSSFAGPPSAPGMMSAGLGLNIPSQENASGNFMSSNLMPVPVEIERAVTPAGSIDEHQGYQYQSSNPIQNSGMGDFMVDPNHHQHLLMAPAASAPSPHQSPFQATSPISPHDPWSPSGAPPDTPADYLGSGAPSPVYSNHGDASTPQWVSHHSSPSNQVPPGVDPVTGYMSGSNGPVQPPNDYGIHPTVSNDSFDVNSFSFQEQNSLPTAMSDASGFLSASSGTSGFPGSGGDGQFLQNTNPMQDILAAYQANGSQPGGDSFSQQMNAMYGGQPEQQGWSAYPGASDTQQSVKIESFDTQLGNNGPLNGVFGSSPSQNNFNNTAFYTQQQPIQDSAVLSSNMPTSWNPSTNEAGFQQQYPPQQPAFMQATAPVDSSNHLHPRSAIPAPTRSKPVRKRSQSASDIHMDMNRQQYVSSIHHMHDDLTENTMVQASTFGIPNMVPEVHISGQGPANVRQTRSLNYHQLGHRKSHSGLPSITVTPDGMGDGHGASSTHYHPGHQFPSFENRHLARPMAPMGVQSDPQISHSGMHSLYPFQNQAAGVSTSYAGQQNNVAQTFTPQSQPPFNHASSFPPPNPNQPLSVGMYSMPNSSAESLQNSPVKPKQQGQRSEVNEPLLRQAFTNDSRHPDPALRVLLDLVRASHFYLDEEVEPTQGSPEAEQIFAEIRNMFPDDPRFAARTPADTQADLASTVTGGANANARDTQSIYMLFTENNQCLICEKKTDRSTRALGHVRSDIGHRPYHCGCDKCQTSTNPRSFFSENLLDDHLKGQTHKQTCNICGHDFRRGGISRHMDSKHPNDPRNPRNAGRQ